MKTIIMQYMFVPFFLFAFVKGQVLLEGSYNTSTNPMECFSFAVLDFQAGLLMVSQNCLHF